MQGSLGNRTGITACSQGSDAVAATPVEQVSALIGCSPAARPS